MSLEELKMAKHKVIGVKQTLKAVEKGEAERVYIADDAEERVVKDLKALCEAKGVPIHRVESMALLGKTCKIEVGAAAAALLKV